MKQFKIYLVIFFILAASRLIPHPPNFTPLIALSFYIPIFLGLRSIPFLIISFIITDIIIGYHNFTHWTWGAVFLISLFSSFFSKNFIFRISGALSSSIIFFIITNFGVWISGMYEYNIQGLIKCFVLAIPFFTNSFFATILFSLLIELIFKLSKSKNNNRKIIKI